MSGRDYDASCAGRGRALDTILTLFLSRETGLFKGLCVTRPRKKRARPINLTSCGRRRLNEGRFDRVMGSQYQIFPVYGRNCRTEISTSAMASPRLPETEGSIPKSQLALRCHSPERVYDSEEFRDQDGPAFVRNGTPPTVGPG
jgi:hypothetical protein